MNQRIRMFSVVVALLISSVSYGITGPKFLNLEGRLTDPEGNPIITSTVVEFRVFWGGGATTGDAGTLKYRETATIVPANDGTYQHKLGNGTPLDGVPLTINTFDTTQDVFLQVNIAGSPLLPRLQFGNMPFAYHPETPTGMLAMFTGPCPTGWTRFSAMDGRFPQGNLNYGGTGGTTQHDHGGVTGQGNEPQESDAGRNFGAQGQGHRHSITATSHIPPYLNVVFCQKD